jgi:hypothetical protein
VDDDAARVLVEAERKTRAFVDELIGEGLVSEWGAAATTLYKEQYALKQNPYGEPWDYRAGDEKRKTSSWRFGRVASTDRESFSLIVARSNANRSCVPFEPRGLGRWSEKFREILSNRAASLAGSVK